MCLITPASARKKQSKKSPSKTSDPASKPQPPARVTSNATTSHSHTVELPSSHLPPYVVQKARSETPAADAPSPFQYLEHAGLYTATSATVPPWGASPSDCKHRDTVLGDIDFVQSLSTKLSSQTSTGPKAPTEAEKKIQAEVQRIADILKQKERDDEIAAAVAKGKAEGKAEAATKEKAAEEQRAKENKLSCNYESCGCCPEKTGSRNFDGRDGFVFHLHRHDSGVPLSSSHMCNKGLGCVNAVGVELYEAGQGSWGDATTGYRRRMMDKVRHVEARTAVLEAEMDMGWERDVQRERMRLLGMERDRYRYPGAIWGRGYL